MSTRRQFIVNGMTIAVGLGSQIGTRNATAASPWTPLPNGEIASLNGIRYEAECGSNPAALQQSTRGVFRFSMIPGNLWPDDDPDDSERTELDGWRGHIASSGPVWAAWSMYYEPGPWSTADWCILRQVYAKYPNRGGPWSVVLLKPGGQLMWVGGAADDPSGFWPLRHKQNISQGQWLNFVETYKFDPKGGKGYWRSWLNGKLVLDLKGAIGKPGVTTRYAKFGIYRSRTQSSGKPVTETINVRFANMRYTTNDLSHLIDKPDPIPAWDVWP